MGQTQSHATLEINVRSEWEELNFEQVNEHLEKHGKFIEIDSFASFLSSWTLSVSHSNNAWVNNIVFRSLSLIKQSCIQEKKQRINNSNISLMQHDNQVDRLTVGISPSLRSHSTSKTGLLNFFISQNISLYVIAVTLNISWNWIAI